VKPETRIAGLDGLRGLAILLVVSYHLWVGITGQEEMTSDVWLVFLYAGNTGVTLFFVLSGFLVCQPFIKSLPTGQLYSVKDYALQRALRILPPYYVVGLIGLICTQRFDQLLPVLLFASHGWSLEHFSAVWWSLATEVQFYLLVPLLFWIALQRWRFPLMLLVGLLAVAAYLAVVSKWIEPVWGNRFEFQFGLILSVLGQMPAFAVGLGIALLHWRCPRPAMAGVLGEHLYIAGLIIVLGWMLLPAARMGAPAYSWHAPWHVMPQALAWGAVVWVMLHRNAVSASLLDNPATRYFGRISFSLYLVHMPVLQLVLSHGGARSLWPNLLLAFMVSVALAHLLYWLVERPSLAFKTKLSRPTLPSGIKV
jgi:peptidoglycan/LPS O-acetylase OafA/YrhL